MAYEAELMRREIQRWARRETPKRGDLTDARPGVRSLENDDERAFDNQGLFYDQSAQRIPGIDDPGHSANFRFPGNSGYMPVLF